MTTELDPKALEAAFEAYMGAPYNFFADRRANTRNSIGVCVSAYLSALPTPDAGDVGELRQRLANVGSPQMRGDNLAVLLASYIEAGIEDDELDESGTWKQGAIDFADEVLDAIHTHYSDTLTAQASRIKELEGERDALRAKLNACNWYWPEDDTSSDACSDGPYEIIDNHGHGEVIAISRGGVVETRYYASLPPAEDADSDDDFEVDEPTEEAASAKVAAELERRSALAAMKGDDNAEG